MRKTDVILKKRFSKSFADIFSTKPPIEENYRVLILIPLFEVVLIDVASSF